MSIDDVLAPRESRARVAAVAVASVATRAAILATRAIVCVDRTTATRPPPRNREPSSGA